MAELKSHNSQLQTSLADIANVVLDNLDESDGTHDAIDSASVTNQILTSTPIKPKIMR